MGCALSAGKSAAANKMNDFQAGAGLKRTEGPIRLFENQPVQLDGDAPGVQAEGGEEAQNGLAVGDLARLALEKDPHGI
jgi:hypothetical protein